MKRILILASVGTLLLACAGDGGDGRAGDEGQIRQLHQDFVRHFKDERWSRIHQLYSQEFRERCSYGDFVLGVRMAPGFLGEAEWEDFMDDLELVAVENIRIEGDTATANVTMEAFGEPETETKYHVKEDGKWRIAPSPGSEGCDD